MEKIKHTDTPTTLINAEDIVRQPKRAEFFSRGAFGDLGASAKRESIGGRFVEKEPIGATMSVVVAEGVPLQFGEPAVNKATNSDNPVTNAERIRALCHFLGADIVGFTPAYEHTWYSHDVDGTPIEPVSQERYCASTRSKPETMSRIQRRRLDQQLAELPRLHARCVSRQRRGRAHPRPGLAGALTQCMGRRRSAHTAVYPCRHWRAEPHR